MRTKVLTGIISKYYMTTYREQEREKLVTARRASLKLMDEVKQQKNSTYLFLFLLVNRVTSFTVFIQGQNFFLRAS